MKKSDINELYGRVSYLLKTLDEPLEDTRYAMMNALLKGLFSHALNVMKNLMLEQTLSLGTAFSAKKVLEYYATLEWLKKQSNPRLVYQRYCDWYAIRQYQTMRIYPQFNDVLFDLEELKDAHDQALERTQKYAPENTMAIIKAPLPFTLDETLDYERLIKEYLPNERTKYIDDYRYLNLLTVPHSYGDLKQEAALRSLYYKVLIVVDILSKKAKDHPHLETFEQQTAFFLKGNSDEAVLYEHMHQQAAVLQTLIKTFTKESPRHVMGDFLTELILLMEDIHSDYFVGLGGLMKCKWGLVVAMMSVFNRADNQRFKMMRIHTDYLKLLTFRPFSEQRQTLLEKAYDSFKSRYHSAVTLTEFETRFKEPLGFLIDENGTVDRPSRLALILLKTQFKSPQKDLKAAPQELLSLMYHQGLLFERVLAAHEDYVAISLREGQNLMFAFDHFVMAMLYSVQRRYEFAQANAKDEDFSRIIEAVKTALKLYFKATNKKHQYFKNQVKEEPSTMVQ